MLTQISLTYKRVPVPVPSRRRAAEPCPCLCQSVPQALRLSMAQPVTIAKNILLIMQSFPQRRNDCYTTADSAERHQSIVQQRHSWHDSIIFCITEYNDCEIKYVFRVARSLNLSVRRKRFSRGGRSSDDQYLCAHRDAVVKVDDVLIGQTDASVGHRVAYQPRLVCAVHPEHCVAIALVEI